MFAILQYKKINALLKTTAEFQAEFTQNADFRRY